MLALSHRIAATGYLQKTPLAIGICQRGFSFVFNDIEKDPRRGSVCNSLIYNDSFYLIISHKCLYSVLL